MLPLITSAKQACSSPWSRRQPARLVNLPLGEPVLLLLLLLWKDESQPENGWKGAGSCTPGLLCWKQRSVMSGEYWLECGSLEKDKATLLCKLTWHPPAVGPQSFCRDSGTDLALAHWVTLLLTHSQVPSSFPRQTCWESSNLKTTCQMAALIYWCIMQAVSTGGKAGWGCIAHQLATSPLHTERTGQAALHLLSRTASTPAVTTGLLALHSHPRVPHISHILGLLHWMWKQFAILFLCRRPHQHALAWGVHI